MRKLYLIAGHGAGDPGAEGNGYTEAERVRALAARIKSLGGSNVKLLDTSRNWYVDGGLNTLEVPGDAGAVELHMDSGPSSAKGAHVIIKKGFEPDSEDRKLAASLAKLFPGRAETIVGRSDLANVNRAAARGINYRLSENGFITSKSDVETFNSKLSEVAKAYLDAFGIPVTSSVSVNPSKAKNDCGLEYRAHVQGRGWLGWVRDGQGAGTTGGSLRLEALEVRPPEGVEVEVCAHVQGRGWQKAVATHSKPATVGSTGKGLRVEAIQMRCLKNATGKMLRYRAHVQDVGWVGTIEPYALGSVGLAKRIECVELWLA